MSEFPRWYPAPSTNPHIDESSFVGKIMIDGESVDVPLTSDQRIARFNFEDNNVTTTAFMVIGGKKPPVGEWTAEPPVDTFPE